MSNSFIEAIAGQTPCAKCGHAKAYHYVDDKSGNPPIPASADCWHDADDGSGSFCECAKFKEPMTATGSALTVTSASPIPVGATIKLEGSSTLADGSYKIIGAVHDKYEIELKDKEEIDKLLNLTLKPYQNGSIIEVTKKKKKEKFKYIYTGTNMIESDEPLVLNMDGTLTAPTLPVNAVAIANKLLMASEAMTGSVPAQAAALLAKSDDIMYKTVIDPDGKHHYVPIPNSIYAPYDPTGGPQMAAASHYGQSIAHGYLNPYLLPEEVFTSRERESARYFLQKTTGVESVSVNGREVWHLLAAYQRESYHLSQKHITDQVEQRMRTLGRTMDEAYEARVQAGVADELLKRQTSTPPANKKQDRKFRTDDLT